MKIVKDIYVYVDKIFANPEERYELSYVTKRNLVSYINRFS